MNPSNSSSPVSLKPGRIITSPLVFAAFGMALAYYAYPMFISAGRNFLFVPLFLLAVITSFFQALCYTPCFERQSARKAAIIALTLLVGFSLGLGARRSVQAHPELGFPPETIRAVSGILTQDPRSLQRGSGLGEVKLTLSVTDTGARASARGNMTVFFPSESIPYLKEFGRGSEIYLDGTYHLGHRGPVFNASSVHIVKAAPAIEQFRTSLRLTLLDKFQSREGQEPVWGSLTSALLLGVRDDLDVDLSTGFRNSGVAYILALSGMHLAIISAVLAFLLRRPLGIYWASLVGAVFIIAYVFVAGPQPSLVRAAIMYLIGTFALWGFLKKNSLSILSMAFILQLIFQSRTGISLSFILSYAAMVGILVLSPALRNIFRGRLPEILSGTLSVSLGAFIATSPVVAAFFGSLKPVGIMAGLLVVPLTTLFMIFSLAALIASFIPLPLWNIFDFILTGIYRLMELTVLTAGRVPGFTVSNFLPVLGFTIILSILILYIQKKDQAYRNSIASFD